MANEDAFREHPKAPVDVPDSGKAIPELWSRG